jgi:hypothetical protein
MSETVEQPTRGPEGQPYGVACLDADGVTFAPSWYWMSWEARDRGRVLADLGYCVRLLGAEEGSSDGR